jgi:hypothetical protein
MPNTKRDLIHDTHASSVSDTAEERKRGVVIDDDRANNLYIGNQDFTTLAECFSKLRDKLLSPKKKYQGFDFNGSMYTFVRDQCRINVSRSEAAIDYVRADLVFTRTNDDSQRWIRVTYTLYRHNKSGPVLAFIGNPTTIVSGSNIRPIRVDDVSRFQETLYFYKLGFLLPPFIFSDHDFSWEKKTARKIQQGEINVSNTQWALYLPSEDKKIDMVLLAGLYCGRSVNHDRSMSLAEYLGFESSMTMKGKDGKLSGVFLVKKRSNNHVLTINFYDKRQSVSNKKQGKTLTAEEIQLIDNALRLDITAHAPFLVSIVNAARKHAERLIKVRPALRKKFDRFLLTKPNRITAYMICRAMSILAVQIKGEEMYKGSFTTWLLNRVLEEELHLISILKFGAAYLHTEARDETHNAILKVWRELTYQNEEGVMIAVLKRFPDYGRAWFYKQRKQIIEQYGLDILVPYNYWLELSHLNQAYGLSQLERARLYDARFNPELTNEQVGKMVKDLSRKSSRTFNKGTRKLLASLQLVAQQVLADKLDVRLLEG